MATSKQNRIIPNPCRPEDIAHNFQVIRETIEKVGLYPFELTQALDCGGEACAMTLDFAGETAKPIKVFDHYGDKSGEIGYFGWAAKSNETTVETGCGTIRYWVVEIDTSAVFIDFELTDNVSLSGSGQWEATVTRWYGGHEPEYLSGTTLNVWDEDEYFPQKYAGALGKAVWDPCERKYRIIECQQLSYLLRATVAKSFCSGDATVEIVKDSQQALFFSPFNQIPETLHYASNDMGLAATAGSQIILSWDETAQGWFVLQVPHVEVSVVTDVTLSVDPCQMSVAGSKRTIAVPVCSGATPFSSSVVMEPITLANALYAEGCDICLNKVTICAFPYQTPAGADCVSFNEVDVITGASFVGPVSGGGSGAGSGSGSTPEDCYLQLSRQRVCVLGTPTNTTALQLDFLPQEVMVDLYDSGTDLIGTCMLVYVPCTGDTYECVAIETTECPAGSGSGSGSQ